MTNPDPALHGKLHLTIGGKLTVILGLPLLVLPGGCSLYVFITSLPKLWQVGNNELLVYLYLVIGIGFALALAGFFLLRAGLRRRRAPGV